MKTATSVGALSPSEAVLVAELKARQLDDEEIGDKILQRRELMKTGKIKLVGARSFITDVTGGIVIERSNASEEDNELVKDRQREYRSAARDSQFATR